MRIQEEQYDCKRRIGRLFAMSVHAATEVLDKLGTRTDKATGVDELSKSRTKLAVLSLCYSENHIAYTGCVPEDWRLAYVSPIFKKESRNKSENYRLVSLTSQICRMFESFMPDTIVKHLESNKFINETKHGFRRGRTCLGWGHYSATFSGPRYLG